MRHTVEAAVQFDSVSKKFYLQKERARSFQELVVSLTRRQGDNGREEFWALRDVSFQIAPGEAVGLVGPNGAGKSTVLKLISRIIAPTSGKVQVRGRVGALLELGSGFHPELTGRENIFLNGSILGMNGAQIRSKLDEIIAFAELGQFIDVPVKHYSSGMFMRLGFAVTVQMEPEILLVDEILAVGDQVFQQKCLNRIGKLKRDGVTIVLVSHSLGNVASLCDRAIWLHDGKVRADDNAEKVVDQYLAYSNTLYYQQQLAEQRTDAQHKEASTANNRWGSMEAEITKIELLGADGSTPQYFCTGDLLRLRIHYQAHKRIDAPAFGLAFYRKEGAHINGPNSVREGLEIPYIDGTGYVDYVIEHLPLTQGDYELTVAIYNHDATVAIDHHNRWYPIEVRSPTVWREEGVVHIPAQWHHTVLSTGH
jgi:ABC-type polysaccharide/polyol phosphate transport system ATPase subunit